jgi:signal transduction histidine kinase/DNA-binding response OmpR family regulator
MNLKSILAVTAVAIVATACDNSQKYRIGVSQNSYDDWRETLNDEINREMIFHDDAEVTILSADDNNEKQIADIEYFINNNYDIIIASPREADAITPILKTAYNKDIPVVIFDREVNGDSYTAYVGADNVQIGEAAGDYINSRLKNGGKVLEIGGLQGSTPAKDRHTGFVSAINNNINLLTTVYSDWTPQGGKSMADSLFNIYNDIDAVFVQNDRMAIAVSESAKNHNINPIIVGIDGTAQMGIKAVDDGVIDATFIYPTGGSELVKIALDILNGKSVSRNNILESSTQIDSSNAHMLLLQNQKLNEESGRIQLLKGQVDTYLDESKTQRSLFFTVCALLIVSAILIFVLLKAYWAKKRNQELLSEQYEKQRDLNAQLQEATQAKLVFFTNVSHDLRTPLTLISDPINQLADAKNLDERQIALVRLAKKNCSILMRLINQILDFRKYESGKLKLNVAEADLRVCFAEWADSFKAMAFKRHVHFNLHENEGDNLTMAVDVEKMERVFFNLVSNSFKYTPENGSIDVTVANVNNTLQLTVDDTGVGIPVDEIGHIFEQFYQVDKVHAKGSGIGLALVKAFVNLHGGDISVKSKPGEGTIFYVSIPVTHVSSAEVYIGKEIDTTVVTTELSPIEAPDVEIEPNKLCVLAIDDNADIRTYIRTMLNDSYQVIEAADGLQGIKMASKYVPDLIICDVMMPNMDGMECVRRLKSEVNTSHIPVLMLTACSLDEQRIEGYESGVDAYLSKPFSAGVFVARCKALIENRKRIKEVLTDSATASQPAQKQAAPKTNTQGKDIDNEFYNRFLKIVEKELSNPELSVEELGSRLGMSRVQFYRKIKAITNYSPVELLRNIRLKRAAKMLSSSERTVSEIAYEVGFTTPSYFTKCFKDYFGESPSDLQHRTSKIE